MKNLSDIPSVILREALDDLKLAEASDKYSIEMTDWHEYDSISDTCFVCLGGAVLAFSCDENPRTRHDDMELSNDIQLKLFMLDSFRMGDIMDGLAHYHREPLDPLIQVDRVSVILYFVDEAKWHKDMLLVIKTLEEIGQ